MPDTSGRNEIYIAGAADQWPLEYYDKTSKSYDGVLKKLLSEAAEQTGYEIHYINWKGKDERLEQAAELQVDAVWTVNLNQDELWKAGLEKGQKVISYRDAEDGTYQEITLAYTSSFPTEARAALEASLGQLSEQEKQELILFYAQERNQDTRLENRAGQFGLLLSGLLGVSLIAAIGASRRWKRKVEQQLCFDDVTGFRTFYSWKQEFRRIVNSENKEHYAVMYFNPGVDSVSHIYGYGEADKLLRTIAEICRQNMDTEHERAARFSEFFFVALVQYTTMEQLKARIRDMYRAIHQELRSEKKKYFVDMQTGIYSLKGSDQDVMMDVQFAQIASEYAMQHSLDCAVYNEGVEQDVVLDFALEHEAVHGLMYHEFQIHFQPMVDMSGTIHGAEALVRWQHPQRGLLKPDDFLPVMKRKQLLGRMNMEIYRQGCQFMKEQLDMEQDFHMLFNFTVENISDEFFAEILNETAEEFGIDRDKIIVQLNQLVEMSRFEHFIKSIREIVHYGFRVCLAGLELDKVFFDYLECGITSVKLRYELIDKIGTHAGDEVVRNVIRLTSNLGLRTIAVGVERKEQVDFLKQEGCEYASGFYFYYPLSKQAFAELMQKSFKNVENGIDSESD